MLSERVGGALARFSSPLILTLTACQAGWTEFAPSVTLLSVKD
jgi:hypothetical protein